MAQGHIIKAVKCCIIHLADTADHGLRAAAFNFLTARCHILMGNQHIALCKINVLNSQYSPDSTVIIPYLLVSQHLGDHCRIDIRKQPERHLPVLIFQCLVYQFRRLFERSGDVNIPCLQQRAEEGQMIDRIMIPGSNQYGYFQI